MDAYAGTEATGAPLPALTLTNISCGGPFCHCSAFSRRRRRRHSITQAQHTHRPAPPPTAIAMIVVRVSSLAVGTVAPTVGAVVGVASTSVDGAAATAVGKPDACKNVVIFAAPAASALLVADAPRFAPPT